MRFAVDGTEYEIDLSDEHAGALRESFAEWIGHARRTGASKGTRGRRASRTSSTVQATRTDTAKIRQWAQENGYTVSSRGRIPDTVREAYDKAH